MGAQISAHGAVRRMEVIALLLMAAAWGWNGGNFSQPDLDLTTQVWVTALHYVPCALLVGFGSLLVASPRVGWARVAVSIVAGLGLLSLAVIVPIGISNSDPNSFGPHNFADYVPVALIVTGAGTWFASQLRRRRSG